MRGGGHLFRQFLLITISIALLAPLANPTITQSDISTLKTYADAFNASRNFMTPYGPAEQYCWTSGTFLAYMPCSDIPTCTQTANLVCTVSGQQGCDLNKLATDILAYKNGVDKLNAAYSLFMAGYNSFSASSVENSLGQMDSAFDAMETAAGEVGQSKLRMPDQIPCPCNISSDCCIGRCPEAHFDYAAISSGKAKIIELRLISCTDGTLGGHCSLQKPLECVLGQLVDNALRCGCPLNKMAVGNTCEYIPCTDNGVNVPEGTCSSAKGKKCVEGILVDKASECGCPAGKLMEGETCIGICTDGTRENECSSALPLACMNGTLVNASSKCGCPAAYMPFEEGCACPLQIVQACNRTSITKYHGVTYLFDRGYEKIVNEPYTFERQTCYSIQSNYGGTNCSQLIGSNTTVVSVSADPSVEAIKQVSCSRCPLVCTRAPPNGLTCGGCACPPNLGFCGNESARANITNTSAYCENELWLPQKVDLGACQNNFECKTDICRNNECYNSDFFQSIINWFRKTFGV